MNVNFASSAQLLIDSEKRLRYSERVITSKGESQNIRSFPHLAWFQSTTIAESSIVFQLFSLFCAYKCRISNTNAQCFCACRFMKEPRKNF